MPSPISILPWTAIASLDDLRAYTGWSAPPNALATVKFSSLLLQSSALFWWGHLATAIESAANDDREAFGRYQRIIDQDMDLIVNLYLKQQLDQANNPSLTSHLWQTLKEATTDMGIVKYKEQDIAFCAEERFNGSKSSSERLLDHIKHCLSSWRSQNENDSNAYLSPYISIIGPSGVGKSFAVKQLASRHSQYVIYISFGKVGGLGIPPRSPVADSYSNIGNKNSRLRMDNAWVMGLTAQILLADCAARMGISPHEFWLLQTDNAGFRDEVASLVYKQILLQPTQPTTDRSSLEKECYTLLCSYARDPSRCMSGNPCSMFIIAIDEARGLFTLGSGAISNSTAFRALRTSLSNLSKQFNVFALFLDTTSQVANFSPPTTFDSSQKSVNHDGQTKKRLFSPFYQFYTYRLFSPKSIDLQDPDISPATVLRYGHPMLGAFLDAGLNKHHLLEIISQKLEPRIARDAGALSEIRHLALLLYLVSFEVLNYQYSSKLVSGWMHVLSSISDDRERVMLGQSISPALALCALRHLTADNLLVNALWDFADKLAWGHVNVRDVGEVVAGLCLVLSMGMSKLDRMSPMPLQDFVRRFLNSDVSSTLLREPHSENHSWIKTGKVFFNRVIRFHSSSRQYPTAEDLLYLYSSCCACFLPENTEGVDIIVPVWIPGSPDYAARMGCILLQVKNRKNDTLALGVRNEARCSITDGVKSLAIDTEKTPVLGMMVCLRMSPTGRGGSAVVTAGDGGHIPVCIGVGLDSDVFSFLWNYPVEVRGALRNLLTVRTNKKYMNDHYLKYVYETTLEDRDLDIEEDRYQDKEL